MYIELNRLQNNTEELLVLSDEDLINDAYIDVNGITVSLDELLAAVKSFENLRKLTYAREQRYKTS